MRAGALLMALMLCLTLLIGAAPSGRGASGDGEAWVKVTSESDFTSGQYYMVTDTGYAPGVLDGGWISAVQVAEGTAPTGAVWTLTISGNEVTLMDQNGTFVKPNGGNKNGISSGEYEWAWSFADGKFTFSGQGEDTVKLASNKGSENKFRGYKTATIDGNPSGYPSEFTLYRLEGGSGEAAVAAPQASPQAGAVVSGTEITLSCATSGANIYYTLDGTDPTTSSTLYNDNNKPTITANCTLKAVAIKDGVSSAVQTLKYTIKAETVVPIANGDKVVIYNPGSGLAMSADSVSTYYRGRQGCHR